MSTGTVLEQLNSPPRTDSLGFGTALHFLVHAKALTLPTCYINRALFQIKLQCEILLNQYLAEQDVERPAVQHMLY